jgi:hypothetical protein
MGCSVGLLATVAGRVAASDGAVTIGKQAENNRLEATSKNMGENLGVILYTPMVGLTL